MKKAQTTPEIKREGAVGTPSRGGANGDAPMRLEGGGDKRAKFAAVPPVMIDSDEIRGIKSGEPFIKSVIRMLEDKGLLDKKYINGDTGWDIVFNARSVHNVMGHRAGVGKAALLEGVPKLIESGVFLESIPKNDKGLVSHIFAAKATIDMDKYTVGFIVREDVNGRRYYDHAIMTDIKEGFRAEHQTRRPNITEGVPPENHDSILNIIKKHLGVNPLAENLSATRRTR